MGPTIRFLLFLLSNLVFIAIIIWAVDSVWMGKLPALFGILFLIIALLRWPDLFIAYKKASAEDDNYSIDLSLKPAVNNRVTPEFITEILGNPKVVQVIKNDLTKTRQIGYAEEWRLGLLTPDTDRYDLGLAEPSMQEILKKSPTGSNSGLAFADQIHLERTAVLHSTSYFKINNIAMTNGTVKPLGRSKWSYGLSTKLNRGEFIDIRNIQVEDDSKYTEHSSEFLPEFLREDGFPLKESYADGDPLTTDRGGTIVMDKSKVIVIYPRYFVQRRLIDDEGNLVDLGLDENFSYGSTFQVYMRPSVSRLLTQRVSSKGYFPVVRYRSFPYASDFMVPILDTPTSDSGWADLFIDTRGKGKLYIAKNKTLAEWYEMMNRLKQLFYSELARKDCHLLGLTKDRDHLTQYLSKKQNILEDYYIIQDWTLS